MKKLGPDAARDLLLLSFVAGSADAAGYMGLGHVFTSNMTGNVVLLGIALAQGRGGTAVRTFAVLLMFSLGTIAGGWMARGLPETAWRRLVFRVVLLECALFATFAFCWASQPLTAILRYFLLALLAVGMGLQSALLHRLTIAGVTNTALTGTLTSLATGLGNLLTAIPGDAAPRPRQRLGILGAVLVFYGLGALLNGLLIVRARWAIGLAPVLCLVLVTFIHRKSAGGGHSVFKNIVAAVRGW